MAEEKPGKPNQTDPKSPPVLDSGETEVVISTPEQAGHKVVPRTSAFAPGSTLAGRFRIIRFIARGGMGEVYEAEDRELKERVAIKTISPEGATAPNSGERFRREIQLARKVTHHNVCRTNDVFRHIQSSRSGSPSETLFVSMELLNGETLERRIKRAAAKRLTTAEALPILKQIAAGLQAAHQANVVHRDFKSSNVMLVPEVASPGGLRAVITDFGLAQRLNSEDAQLTRIGGLVGTPAFMAPEQVYGGEISPATDIYALGLVAFQMVTGEIPFLSATGEATAKKRLSEVPPSPRTFVRDLDENWERGILGCLERKPEDRFASTEQFIKAIEGELITPRKHVVRRLALLKRTAVFGVLVLVVLAAGTYIGLKNPTLLGRPSVAVLGFADITGQEDPSLGGELTETLGSQLDIDQIHFIPTGTVNEMKQNLGIRELESAPPRSVLAKLHDDWHCDYVITGTYAISGEAGDRKILWNVHVLRTKDGESLGTVSETMAASQRLDSVKYVGNQVREKLHVRTKPSDFPILDAGLPRNPEAAKYVAEGKKKLLSFDVAAARKLFESAASADPNYAEAHSQLAEAYWNLGYETRAKAEAQKAVDLSGALSSEAKSLIKARYDRMSKDWKSANDLYASLWNISKESQYGLSLARNYIDADQPAEALAVLEKLKKEGIPPAVLAQVQLEEAAAQGALGNDQERLRAATQADQTAESIGAHLLSARALISKCLAMLSLNVTQAAPVCEAAVRENQDIGDPIGMARAVNAIGDRYLNQGDYRSAEPYFQKALQVASQSGDKLDEGGALQNLANVRLKLGDAKSAADFYQKSIDVLEERGGAKDDIINAQQTIASMLFSNGDRGKALSLYAQAIRTADEIGARDTKARILNNRCSNYLDAGDLKLASRDCEDSLFIRRQLGINGDLGRSFQNMGDVYLAMGDLLKAKGYYQHALEAQESVGAKEDAAIAGLSLAWLALQSGEPQVGRTQAEKAIAELPEGNTDDKADALGALALADLALGDRVVARSVINQASELVEKSEDQSLKMKIGIARAQIDARGGNRDEAVNSLVRIQNQARNAGLLGREFEARLALGRLQLQLGKKAAGHATLAVLAHDAEIKGYGLIAKNASGAT